MSRYVLQFGVSPSTHYRTAVELARLVPGYECTGTGRELTHRVPADAGQLPLLERLIALIAGWRSTTLEIDGMMVGRAELHRLMRLIACHRERELSGLEELYCWGLPGEGTLAVPCRLVALSFPLSAPAAYTDPALLGPLVTAHARAVMADACPAFDAEAIEAAARRHFGVEAPLNPMERRTLERLLDGLTLDLDDEPHRE